MIVTMEDVDKEWKEIWKTEYLKTIGAFYNTAGGRFIVGRRDDGTFIGVKDVKGTLKSISDSIQNTLGITANVHAQLFDDQLCIVVDVPKGRNKVDYDGRFYKRVGNTTQMIRREELKDIIADERGTFWMDDSSGKSIEIISADTIERFVEMGKEVNRIPKSIDPSDIATVLDRYDLLCDDGTVTIAGALLFSERPRRFNHGAYLKIGEFDDKGVLRREDIVDAPLVLVPDMAVDILFDRYIPPTFGYEGAFRKIVYSYPRDAIRELIVNAVVHMDYRSEEPVTVSIHPGKIEIFCLGGRPDGWTIDTLIGKHTSVLRNKTLANVFHDAGYVENWAQGIGRVMESCRSNDNPPPEFVLELGGLSVTVFSNDSQQEASQEIEVPLETFTPTEKQKLIIDCISSNPFITQNGISEVTGIPLNTVRNNISRMVDAGIIRREGSKKDGRWVLVSR